ncbi:MAG: glycosyltransferase family 2 protein [Bacteroidales bacterium]|nr:glycosyltransferase family 2 protein [Bacteroidales bacterium]
MKLSVIIVNYSVRYFLEQCLQSVLKAATRTDCEIWVVDNNSVDGSVKMLSDKFPDVKVIANRENTGFSRANNQAIKKAKGEYVLLLNPDTVVEEDTFIKVVDFMDQHPEAGGLGVKMVDGNGNFLPESKRGLPTPSVAFFKIFGLSKLFPKSKQFSRYHLGYLNKEEIHSVDVLSGAFMLLKKEALDKTGLLDEDFFMYGEDIDLSYRITQAGYKNYYFPKTRIIHYKGESTKKSSINYVVIFYKAMVIFARKHFSQKNATLFSFLINIAIYFRAFLSIVSRFIRKAALPFGDALLLFGGIIGIKNYWEHNIIFPQGGNYPVELVSVAIPLYIIIWLMSVYLSGGYDKPIRLAKLFQGMFIGSIVILTLYALLPESYRFSRALIIFGAVWGMISMTGIRFILHILNFRQFKLGLKLNKRFAIVGNLTEAQRIADLIRKATLNPGFIGLISISEDNGKNEGFIGNLDQIKEIIYIYKIDEVIFCAKDLSSDKIIDKMSELSNRQIEFRIAPPESLFIIGSKSINTSGDIYVVELDSITKNNNKRSKRFLDIFISIILVPVFPLAAILTKNPVGFVINLFSVLFGRRSWVGYETILQRDQNKLPKIKPGVLNPTDIFKGQNLSSETIGRLNLLYARDYKVINDLNIIFKGFRNTGRC